MIFVPFENTIYGLDNHPHTYKVELTLLARLLKYFEKKNADFRGPQRRFCRFEPLSEGKFEILKNGTFAETLESA